jgi:hypothetical protein
LQEGMPGDPRRPTGHAARPARCPFRVTHESSVCYSVGRNRSHRSTRSTSSWSMTCRMPSQASKMTCFPGTYSIIVPMTREPPLRYTASIPPA